MLLVLIILPILATANPFHKYPYVFLLDVGNEELEKVNTEQIRLSSPGGSVALRYPAIGDGDDIAHVRVSGIDFGTDLKANILDGGPGYKYVVIVLMGNSGVEYDAVITVQTVPNVDNNAQAIENNSIENQQPTYQVSEDDPNSSAEDLKDYDEEPSQVGNKNAELIQESSNVHSQNEALSGYGSQHDYESENNDDTDSKNDQYDSIDNLDENISQKDVEVEDYDPNDESNINQSIAERLSAIDNYSQSNDKPIIVDQNLYNRYIALKDHLYDGSEVYSQNSIQANPSNQNYDDIEQLDYYEDNYPGKFRDANNNYIDADEASPVEQ